jgi:hypothetical protein
MPVSFSFTHVNGGELAKLDNVASDLGIYYELVVNVGIACTWSGKFDMVKFEKVTEAFTPNIKAQMQKYLYQDFTFDSWR